MYESKPFKIIFILVVINLNNINFIFFLAEKQNKRERGASESDTNK